MKEVTRIQEQYCSTIDRRRSCSYEIENIDKPTTPLIHQASRFLYFLNGEGLMIIDNVEYELRANTFIAILPWEITEIKEVTRPLEFIKVIYNSNFVNNHMRSVYNPNSVLLSVSQSIEKQPVVYLNEEQADRALQMLQSIKDEIGEEIDNVYSNEDEIDDITNVLIVNKLVEILIFFYRTLALQNNIEHKKKHENENISAIFKYIYSHLQERITLDKLSKVFYMSESAISKYIQDVIGIPFTELVSEMKITKVIDLLMYSDFTLTDIAETVGYTDAPHLLKTFSQRVGLTPNEFRKFYQGTHNVLKKKELDVSYDVVNYIYNNYTEEITAQQTCEKFGINLVELNRILMFQLEKNFTDYLDYLRINKACEMLITTPDAICDIAVACGYNTTKTFSRLFINHKGMTPGVFRKTIDLQNTDGSISYNLGGIK